ncbi:hypothetical protein [Mycolicibacterium baixiangningiae]|uniref:hypothetical protein n=1 Tax=Mycolicibacterium baixiangningiae TaxID=2761578 RepID=UPI001D008C63|nr:hypothetical protein [Mycolicibacterium baixiangningiae]
MLLVVALAVTVTILVTRDGSDGNSPTPPGDGQASEFASANDTGPVNIITEDPTCDAWGKVIRAYSDKSKSVNWGQRDPSIPASAWTPEQRNMYEVVSNGMRDAASQAEKLAKTTPHRVMRELYGQFVAYSAAFVTTLEGYTEKSDGLAVVTDASGTAAAHICSAIEYRSVQPIAPLVEESPAPSSVELPDDGAAPQRFLTTSNPACDGWESSLSDFDRKIADWLAIDPQISAPDWSPAQRSVNEAAAKSMVINADVLEELGRESRNPIFEDLAALAAQYRRAFALTIPEYESKDGFLSESATYLARTVNSACKAVA